MRRVLVALLTIAALAACSDDPSGDETQPPTTEPAPPEEEANFHLDISNQSFRNPDVGLVVSIDGDEVVAKSFAVEGQHTVESFPFAIEAGSHRIEIVADDGSELAEDIEVPGDAPLYANVSYWGPDGGGRELIFQTQDEPFAYA